MASVVCRDRMSTLQLQSRSGFVQRWMLVAVVLGGQILCTSGDFMYPDFATVCDPSHKCSPLFEGTLKCCNAFTTDADSWLYINSGAHFQTCAQFHSPTGEVEGLKGRDAVFNQDRADDPQIMITQLTEVDYEASPRRSLTYNWTRSVFEEVVRRRNELRAELVDAIEKLRVSRASLHLGLEPDANGQVWLIIAMQQTEVTRLEKLYNQTLEHDRKLFLEHRKEYVAIHPKNDHGSACDNRMRLTPAAPTRRGSIWYKTPQKVTHGFMTTFKFQLSARNRFCKNLVEAHADQMKGVALTVHYDECLRAAWNASEWSQRVLGLGGGDGFAFVIQGGGGDVVGDRGNELGFGGIPDSIAIEFDTYQNKEYDDVNDMHVAVHTGGCRKANGADGGTRLAHYGPLRTTNRYLQDGEVHEAKIIYTPGLEFNPDTQPYWSSTPYLQQFVKSDGIGTLRVFLDDMQTAVINMPLSLKYALKLTDGRARVGFTASTGSMWQNHDLLEWSFREYCPNPGNPNLPDMCCPGGLADREQCLKEKRWPTVGDPSVGCPLGQQEICSETGKPVSSAEACQGGTFCLLEGTPFFEPGGEPWNMERQSVCTTCP